MSDVFVERKFDAAITADDVRNGFKGAIGCFEIHSVQWKGSFLSFDHCELFCHFTSTDAEAVRIALNQAGAPRGRVWAGSIHDAAGITEEEVGLANVLVLRTLERPAAFEEIQALGRQYADCMGFHRVRFLRTLLSSDGRRMLCFYQASDAESVRILQRAANMPFDRVLTVEQFRP